MGMGRKKILLGYQTRLLCDYMEHGTHCMCPTWAPGKVWWSLVLWLGLSSPFCHSILQPGDNHWYSLCLFSLSGTSMTEFLMEAHLGVVLLCYCLASPGNGCSSAVTWQDHGTAAPAPTPLCCSLPPPQNPLLDLTDWHYPRSYKLPASFISSPSPDHKNYQAQSNFTDAADISPDL